MEGGYTVARTQRGAQSHMGSGRGEERGLIMGYGQWDEGSDQTRYRA